MPQRQARRLVLQPFASCYTASINIRTSKGASDGNNSTENKNTLLEQHAESKGSMYRDGNRNGCMLGRDARDRGG